MKSIKPGCAPSMMSAVMSVAIGIFGIIWTVIAARISGFMAVFGIVFIVIAIIQAVYNFKNATNKNRYSAFDIVDGEEESDPLNERFGEVQVEDEAADQKEGFCPYCGAPLQETFAYCPKCGKRRP